MDPDYLLPPPAYSEQEFDQKISQATALSIHTPQAHLTNIDPDGWPQYDPAAFEATVASECSSSSPTTVSPFPVVGKKDDYMQHGTTNDLPSIVPLRIEKKSHKKSNLPKPPAISQPGDESSSLIIGGNSTPTLFYPGTSDCDDFGPQPHSVQSRCSEDDVSLTVAPPVHSMQMVSNHKKLPSIPSPFVAHPTARPTESSVLARPFVYDNHYQHVDPHDIALSQSPRQSLPIQARPRFVSEERPVTSHSPSPNNFQSSPGPSLDFNPYVAYGKTQPAAPPLLLKQTIKNVQYDPHAFYNSAVSAQITPNTTGQHGHPSYSSYNSRNSFSPQYQQQGLPATYSRPSHYNQSFVSQNAPSPPPARPSSSYSMSSNYQTFNASPSAIYQHASHTANIPGNIYYDQQSAENRWSTQ